MSMSSKRIILTKPDPNAMPSNRLPEIPSSMPGYMTVKINLIVLQQTASSIQVVREDSNKSPIWLPLRNTSTHDTKFTAFREVAGEARKHWPIHCCQIQAWLFRKVRAEL